MSQVSGDQVGVHTHPYLLNTPPQLRDALAEDAEAQALSFIAGLRWAARLHDYGRAGRVYCRKLKSHLAAALPLTTIQRVRCMEALFSLAVADDLSALDLGTAFLDLLARLARRKVSVGDFFVQWRPLYDLILRVHFRSRQRELLTGWTPAQRRAHASALTKAIAALRRYFEPTATEELLQLLVPQLDPTHNDLFRAQAALCLFLPTHAPEVVVSWLPSIITALDYAERSTHYFAMWMDLLSRAAKHGVGVVDLRPHVRRLATQWMQLVNLSVGGGSDPSDRTAQEPQDVREFVGSQGIRRVSSKLAKLLVYSMRPGCFEEGGGAGATVKRLLKATSTFFHPSNSRGGWSGALGEFVSQLTRNFAKRRVIEDGVHAWLRVPPEVRLDHADESFVRAVMPVGTSCMYSKDMSMMSAGMSFFGEMCTMYPDVVMPPLLERLYPDLTTVVETARMHAALRVTLVALPALLNPTIMPEGPGHIEQLLWLALPGIDPTDVSKAAQTLSLLSSIFCRVPFVAAPLESQQNQEEEAGAFEAGAFEAARQCTLIFPEWSTAFMDRVLQVLEHLPAFSKKSGLDRVALASLGRTVESFFQAASEPIFNECFAKTVASPVCLSALNHKAVGLLFRNASATFPQRALDTAFPVLHKRLLDFVETVAGVSTLSSIGTEQQERLLYLMCQLVRFAGVHLLPLLDADDDKGGIRSSIRLALSSKDKGVRKAGGRLLRNTLRALTGLYVLEARPICAAATTGSVLPAWQTWSRFEELHLQASFDTWDEHRRREWLLDRGKAEWFDLALDWHFPSEPEMCTAESLVREFSRGPLQLIESVIGGEAAQHPQEELQRALSQLVQVVRGANTVLGAVDSFADCHGRSDAGISGRNNDDGGDSVGEEQHQGVGVGVGVGDGDGDDEDDGATLYEDASGPDVFASGFSGRRVPIVQRRSRLAAALPVIVDPDALGVPLRLSLCRSALTIGEVLWQRWGQPAEDTNVKCLTLVVKLIRHLLFDTLVNDQKHNVQSRMIGFVTRAVTRAGSPFGCDLRKLRVESEVQRLHERMQQTQFGLPYVPVARKLVGLLQRFSVSEFSKVRAKASAATLAATRAFPLSIDSTVQFMADVVSSQETSKEALKGALGVLGGTMHYMGRSWRRLRRVLLPLLRCGQQHDDDEAQAALHHTFNSAFFSMCVPPTQVNPPSTSLPAWGVDMSADGQLPASKVLEMVSERDAAVLRFNKKARRDCSDLQAELLSILNSVGGDSPSLHWRYELMTCSSLLMTITRRSPPPLDVVMSFAGRLVSNLSPMRSVSALAVSAILQTFQLHSGTRQVERTLVGAEDVRSAIERVQVSVPWVKASPSDPFEHGLCDGDAHLEWVQHPAVRHTLRVVSPRSSSTQQQAGAVEESLLSAHVLDSLLGFVRENWERIVMDHFVDDHPTLHASDADPDAPAKVKSRGGSSGRSALQNGFGQKIADAVEARLLAAGIRLVDNRFKLESNALSAAHICFFEAVFASVPEFALQDGGAGTGSAPCAHVFQTLCADTYKRESQVTAAEMFAGLMRAGHQRGVVFGPELVGSPLHSALLGALRIATPECVTDWDDAIRIGCSGADPRRHAAWIMQPLLEDAFGGTISEDGTLCASRERAAPLQAPSVQGKRFTFLASALLEGGWRTRAVSEWVLQRVEAGGFVHHAYTQVRQGACGLVLACTRNLCRRTGNFAAVSAPAAAAFFDACVSHLQTGPEQREAGGDAVEASSSSKEAEHLLDFICVTTGVSSWVGDSVFHALAVETFLTSTLGALGHKSSELAEKAENCCKMAAWSSHVVGNRHEAVVQRLISLAQDPEPLSWKVKVGLLQFLDVYAPRHCLMWSKELEKALLSTVVFRLLRDANQSVREQASHTLTSILMFMSGETVNSRRDRDVKRFWKWLNSGTDAEAHHGGALGLAAYVRSEPYDVPAWLPPVLALFCGLASSHDRDPLRGLVQSTMAEFHRTHRDCWADVQERFTPEEMDALRSVVSAPSYFA